jgi:hypothetical protein
MLDVVAMFLTGRSQACAALQRLEWPIEELSRVGKRLLWLGKATGGALLSLLKVWKKDRKDGGTIMRWWSEGGPSSLQIALIYLFIQAMRDGHSGGSSATSIRVYQAYNGAGFASGGSQPVRALLSIFAEAGDCRGSVEAMGTSISSECTL